MLILFYVYKNLSDYSCHIMKPIFISYRTDKSVSDHIYIYICHFSMYVLKHGLLYLHPFVSVLREKLKVLIHIEFHFCRPSLQSFDCFNSFFKMIWSIPLWGYCQLKVLIEGCYEVSFPLSSAIIWASLFLLVTLGIC